MTTNEKNKVEGGVLYLVATPIGNLADITERAKKVLAKVDFIAAEDTRNTARLLSVYEIKNELVSYHEHNRKECGPRLVARLLSGEAGALVTDAGMPVISDPGEEIVALCAAAGVEVRIVPGCCAAVSALALSALPSMRFCFEGFLPAKKGDRQKRLSALKNEERTMIFYEAPHKLCATLSDMAAAFGEGRRIALCRELTKLNEETMRVTLGEAVRHYEANEPRGEYVLVVEGGVAEESVDISLSPEEHVAKFEAEGMSRMDAIKAAAKERGMTKSELYRILNKD